jgi:deaminated glutathione amidase
VRAAAIQLNSNQEKERNLSIAEPLVREAAADGADLIVLPEKFNVLGSPDDLRAGAEPVPGPTTEWAGELCRELGVWLVAGSIVERVEGDDKLRNTSALIGPDGGIHAVYRKIHLFDVEVGDVSYRESEVEQAGEVMALGEAGEVMVGLTICYDLRFPELYRILALRGARVITVPAAFTERTGRDHWEVLIRARAIEDQVFMVAPGQIGFAPPHYRSFGRSMLVDPWGVVLAQAADTECFVTADLDFAIQDEMRDSLPSLRHRRPETYRWPGNGQSNGVQASGAERAAATGTT